MDRIDPGELESLARKYDESNVPLYVSYPVTSFWKGVWDEGTFARAYGRGGDPFLYFHVPYCRKACYYCCCYKEVTRSESVKQSYVESLVNEFDLRLDTIGVDRFDHVKHMHWGGGTPTYLSVAQIEQICESIVHRIAFADGPDTNISIEAYPDEEVLTIEKLRVLRRFGFNEISFGVQDFNERIQEAINRNCTPDSLRKIIGQSKELGFRVNIDLCYGLPYQGVPELEATIRVIADMMPDKIAVFPYAHYPIAFPLQRKIPSGSVPGSLERIRLIMHAEKLFDTFGYKRIGIDHFVRSDNPLYAAYREQAVVKDFMGYSVDERRSFIGFGSSAISFIGDTFFHNTTSIRDYHRQIGEGRLPSANGTMHRLSADDLVRHRIIQKHILCDFVIDKKTIGREFGIDFDVYFGAELERLSELEHDGLIETVDTDTLAVTPAGKYCARHIAHVFDRYYR